MTKPKQHDPIQEQLARIEAQASSKKGLNLEEKLKEETLKNQEALRGARKWFRNSSVGYLRILSFPRRREPIRQISQVLAG